MMVMLTISAITFVGFIIITDHDLDYLRGGLINDAHSYNEFLSQDFSRIIQQHDTENTQSLSDDISARLRTRTLIEHVVVYDNNHNIVFDYHKDDLDSSHYQEHFLTIEEGHQATFEPGVLRILEPVEYQGVRFGNIFMQLSTSALDEARKRYYYEALVLFMAIMVGTLLLSLYIRHYFYKPIQQLVEALVYISETHDFSRRLPRLKDNEIGMLFDGFNHMQEEIEAANIAQLEKQFAIDQHAIVVMTDVDGAITYANQKFFDISGYSKEELMGRNHRMVKSDVHDKSFFRDLYHTIERGQVWHGEICNKAKAGHLYWLDTTIVPFMNEDGTPHSYIAIRTDVTERKSIETALQHSEQRYDYAMSVVNDGIWDWDISAGNIYFDSRYYTMAGYEPGEFPNSFLEFKKRVHRDDLKSLLTLVDRYIKGKSKRFDVEFRFLRKRGSYLWIRARGKIVEYDEGGKPLRFIGTLSDVNRRKLSEQALRESEMHFRNLIETTSAVVWEYELESETFAYISPQVEALTGYPVESWTGLEFWMGLIHADDLDYVLKVSNEAIETGGQYSYEYRIYVADGSIKWFRSDINIITLDGGAMVMRGYTIDITELKQTEEALRRSQKMDAVGQLTGGIAHDFNNILGIILGNLDLLERQEVFEDKSKKRIDGIRHSAQRAVDLTRQLLGFSRRESVSMRVTDINSVITTMQGLITRSITPQVEVTIDLSDGLWTAQIDPGDLEDALLNLVINARDAMHGSGRLVIETRNRILGKTFCKNNLGIRPGEYIELSISDSGDGMSREVQDRIFEPFFTTKEQGQGTGLGLAMVFGFVQRSAGGIRVNSESGAGTSFHIYLPRNKAELEEKPEDAEGEVIEVLPEGSETLLIVDDEQRLLAVTSEILDALGYRVFTATNAEQALQLMSEEHIDLLFSDVVMPGMNGYELADRAAAEYPELKIQLTSGYTNKAAAHSGQSRFNADLLSKPYTQQALANKIRQKLDEL